MRFFFFNMPCVDVVAFQRFGKKWKDASKEVKDEYTKKAEPLKAQYEVDMAAYKAKKEGVSY